MKKKVLLLSLLMVFCFTLGAFGATKLEWIQVALNSVSVEVNGKPTQASTIIYEGITYVPVSFVARELGAKSQWDSANRKVIITGQTQQASAAPQQTKPAFGHPSTNTSNNSTSQSKSKVKEEMERQIRNIELDVQLMSLDGANVMIVTPQNKTGYTIKYLEIENYHEKSSFKHKFKWSDIEPQGVGEQQRVNLTPEVKGGKMKMKKLKVTFSDGNEEHSFERNFDY